MVCKKLDFDWICMEGLYPLCEGRIEGQIISDYNFLLPKLMAKTMKKKLIQYLVNTKIISLTVGHYSVMCK